MKKILFLLAMFFLGLSLAGAQTDNWRLYKSTHFIIYYQNAAEDFVKNTSDRAEDYYNKIAEDLGFRRFDFWLWDNRAKIYIYNDSSQYQAMTGQPAWSAGCAIMNEKIIKTFPYAQGFFETVLPHEMSHIIFREFVGFTNTAIPLWLDEGVASYQEKLRYSSSRRLLKTAIAANALIGLDVLSNSEPRFLTDSNAVQLFYVEAFSIVNFLINEFGRDKFVSFCQNLRDKRNLEAALRASYPFSNITELNFAWQEYLRK